jgi:hypothetical protein
MDQQKSKNRSPHSKSSKQHKMALVAFLDYT